MEDSKTSPLFLTGTWPVRTHANRFFGEVKADGQHPRVAALACYQGDIVFISRVVARAAQSQTQTRGLQAV